MVVTPGIDHDQQFAGCARAQADKTLLAQCIMIFQRLCHRVEQHSLGIRKTDTMLVTIGGRLDRVHANVHIQ